MFYLENGLIKVVANDAVVCREDEIEKAVYELSVLNSNIPTPVSTDELLEDRLTVEGIDKAYRADFSFSPSLEYWQEDAVNDWRGWTGPQLFERYQKHAEHYCEGCAQFNMEPTYEGFRQYLIRLRDHMGDDEIEP